MPRLPDIDALGERPTPSAVRPIVSYRGGIAEAALAEAHAGTAALGQTIFGTGKAAAEYGQQQDKAAADAGLNEVATHSSKKAGEYAGAEDFQAAPDNYLIDVTQVRDKLAEGIGGAAERQRFIDRSHIFIDSGLNRVRQGARAREVATGVQALDARAANAQTVALQTSDEAERSGIIYTVGADIQAAAERGYIARDTAKQRIDAWKQQFAEGWLDKLVPGDRRMVLEAAAEGSKGGIVSLIPEQRRAQLLPEVRRAADVHAQDSAAEARAAAAQAARDGLANRAAEHRAAFAAAIERRGDLSEAEKAAERARLDRILRANDLLGAYGRATNGDPEAGRAFIERARGDGAIADAGERAAAIRALEAEQGRLETRHAVAQVAAQDRRGREIVQSLLDGNLSRQDAYDEIGAIADPELRHHARRHLAGRFAAEDAAERQERSGALNTALDAVERGTPIGDLPGEVLGKLDPPAIAALRRAEARTAKAGDGPPPASDAKALTRIEALIAEDPQAFARLDLAEARADLNRADYDRFARLQKLDPANPEAAYERATRNAYASALRNAGRDPWSADSEAVRQNFADEVAAFEHIHGRKPDVGEVRKVAEGVAGDIGTMIGGAGDDVITGGGSSDDNQVAQTGGSKEGEATGTGNGALPSHPAEKTGSTTAALPPAGEAGGTNNSNNNITPTTKMRPLEVFDSAVKAISTANKPRNAKFEEFLAILLLWEAGLNKKDKTNRGVRENVYKRTKKDPYLKEILEIKNLPENYENLTPEKFYDYYNIAYFKKAHIDKLLEVPGLVEKSEKLARNLFDASVMSGNEYAAIMLQESINDVGLEKFVFEDPSLAANRDKLALAQAKLELAMKEDAQRTGIPLGGIEAKAKSALFEDKNGKLKLKVDNENIATTGTTVRAIISLGLKAGVLSQLNDRFIERRLPTVGNKKWSINRIKDFKFGPADSF